MLTRQVHCKAERRDSPCQDFVCLRVTPRRSPCFGRKCRALRFAHSAPKFAHLLFKTKTHVCIESASTSSQPYSGKRSAPAESRAPLTARPPAFRSGDSQRGSLRRFSLAAPSAEVRLRPSFVLRINPRPSRPRPTRIPDIRPHLPRLPQGDGSVRISGPNTTPAVAVCARDPAENLWT